MFAAIDAGSNTLRLLIGEVREGRIKPYAYHRRITRLAGGMSAEEGLSPEAMERTLFALLEFARLCRVENVQGLRAVGTAAFRQARNGADFTAKIKSDTGILLDIINGQAEAKLMSSGVLNALDPVPEQALIVDIGGGSTEFVLCHNDRVLWSQSLPLGVVRLTESFPGQPQRDDAISAALSELLCGLKQECEEHGLSLESLSLVGTAGTATTLAALDMQMAPYDWTRVNNHHLTLSRLIELHEQLTPMSVAQRESLPGMESGRGDLIMAGIEILLGLMSRLHVTTLTISDFGILEGLLLSLHEDDKS